MKIFSVSSARTRLTPWSPSTIGRSLKSQIVTHSLSSLWQTKSMDMMPVQLQLLFTKILQSSRTQKQQQLHHFKHAQFWDVCFSKLIASPPWLLHSIPSSLLRELLHGPLELVRLKWLDIQMLPFVTNATMVTEVEQTCTPIPVKSPSDRRLTAPPLSAEV